MRIRRMIGLGSLWMVAAVCGAQGGGRLLVVEKGLQSLAVVDPGTGSVVASVSEQPVPGRDTGHEVASSRDGKLAFVPIYGDSGVGSPGTDGHEMVVIDLAGQKIVQRVDFGHPVRPHLPVLGPPVAGYPEGLLYVTTELDKAVTVLDPKTLKILGSVPTGMTQSHMLVVSHDGKRGYTANVGSGTVSVLDLEKRALVKVIPVAKQVQRISISMDDKLVFTSDQSQPELDVIDTATQAVVKRVPMESTGYGSAVTPDGRWLLVSLMDVNKVAVVDLKTLTVAGSVALASGTVPQAVVVRPDGKAAYVSCVKSGQAAEIALTGEPGSWSVKRMITVGKAADGMVWAEGLRD